MTDEPVRVRIARLPGGEGLPLPARATAGAAAFDLPAAVDGELVLAPGERIAVPTGFALSIPPGYEGQVRPRSGLSLHHGVVMPNAPGTIDSDYRGEVHVILSNTGSEPFAIKRGDRIGQLVIAPVVTAVFEEVPTAGLDETERGSGGFGHTGLKARGEGVSEGQRIEPAPTPEPLHPQPPTPLPEESGKKGASELALRWGTASVLIPAVLYVVAIGGIPYLIVVTLFVLIGQREFYGLIEDKGAQPLVGLGLVAGAALPLVAYVGNEYHATLLMTASLLGFMLAQLRKAQITEALASISGTFFGVFYVGWLLSHAIVLRFFYSAAASKYPVEDLIFLELAVDSGAFFMAFTLTSVVACDAGAYFAGRAYGRRKLAPNISPGKTVEGALGGILAGAAGAVVIKAVFDYVWPELSAAMPYGVALLFGIVLSLVGIMGDLVESLLKRDADVKDAGALLPGMGGILDRIDAPLLAIPVMYYMLLGYLFLRIAPVDATQ